MASTNRTAVRRRVPPQWAIDLINPVVRAVARSRLHRLVDPALLILHLIGRRSGRRLDIPVSYLTVGDRLLVTTQHTWRRNLRGGAAVEVTLRGRRQPAYAALVEDPAEVAAVLHAAIDEVGWPTARRQLAVATADGTVPGLAELTAAAREFDLAVVTVRLG